jgi:hypothetical protein
VIDDAASREPDRMAAFLADIEDCTLTSFDPWPLSGDITVVDASRYRLRGAVQERRLATVWVHEPGEMRAVVFTARICQFLERHGHSPKFCPPGPPVPTR